MSSSPRSAKRAFGLRLPSTGRLFRPTGASGTRFWLDRRRRTGERKSSTDFLGIAENAEERVIDQGLARHIRDSPIELKAGRFKPEHMGKLNFQWTAVDASLRHPDDQPSIGMVLCNDRSDFVAEHALRGATQPMAISQYELTKSRLEDLKGQLPSVEDLEAGLTTSKVEPRMNWVQTPPRARMRTRAKGRRRSVGR